MADQVSDQIKSLLKQGPFSFIGTVTHINATTTPNLPVDDHTAVVTVVHVLNAPPSFEHFEGQLMTLQLSPNATVPAVGETLAFFAEGVAFGEGLALREVGRLPAETVAPHANAAAAQGKTAGAFDSLTQELADESLRDHMKQADAIVVGHVIATTKVGSAPVHEHDPDWSTATLQIHHVERGSIAPGDVQVLFPASLDTRWYRVPKPRLGQSGVWLLHATSGDQKSLAPYVLQHEDDYQPTQKLDLLR